MKTWLMYAVIFAVGYVAGIKFPAIGGKVGL